MSKMIRAKKYEVSLGDWDIGLGESMAAAAACFLMGSIWWGVLVAGVMVTIRRVTIVVTETETEVESEKKL